MPDTAVFSSMEKERTHTTVLPALEGDQLSLPFRGYLATMQMARLWLKTSDQASVIGEKNYGMMEKTLDLQRLCSL